MKMVCQQFRLSASIDDLPTVEAKFVIPISPHRIDEMAEAFKLVTKYMGEKIELVMAQKGKQRCFYCGQLNPEEGFECRKCGASLGLAET